MSDAQYIVDQPALAAFCAELRGADWLALDTEFIREQTYYPQLCLIQVASAGRIACIDPLALPTLEPLLAILYDPNVIKVLHAAYQDLEVFYHLCGAAPTPIFDTQCAAALLGYGQQLGYAALVQQLLGVSLEKHYTRVNWRQRPLAADWLAYAADDVRYLREIYLRLQALLAERGALPVFQEACAALADPARYQPQPQEAWQRVRDHQRLRGDRRCAVLQGLAAWREEQAMRDDRPRRWILQDGPLLELARILPADLESLGRIRGLPPATVRRHGHTLLALIAAIAEPE